jgi:hypothetical protein
LVSPHVHGLANRLEDLAGLLAEHEAQHEAGGADIRILPHPDAPCANAVAERWIGTLRRECLDHLLIPGPRHVAEVLREYIEHYVRHEAPLDHVEVKGLHQQAVAAAW